MTVPLTGGSRRQANPLDGFERAVRRVQPPSPARQSPPRAAERTPTGPSDRRLAPRPEPVAPPRPAPTRRAARRGPVGDRGRRRAQIRRNRIVAASAVAGLVAILLAATLGGASAPRAAAGAHRGSPVGPPPAVHSLVASHLIVAGRTPSFAWPARGEAAVGVAGVGVIGHSARQIEVPVASLTKMMTAYLILRDHPLSADTGGPSLRISAADVADWVHASQNDYSNVQVKAGEMLNEYQLLEALLLPSADNIADLLAIWDAGSIPAFVQKMNATASALGMTSTHYADASGVSHGSRSDAVDQERLAALLIESPVIRSIVRHPALGFPVAGTITNYNPALGVDGIIGLKSGFTQAAQGCLATAAYRVVGGHRVLVVSVSLGQLDGLYGAARVDERLLVQASGVLRPVPVLAPRQAVARLSGSGAAPVVLQAPASATTVVGWPQLVLDEQVVPRLTASPSAPAASSLVTSAASLQLRVEGRLIAAVPLLASSSGGAR